VRSFSATISSGAITGTSKGSKNDGLPVTDFDGHSAGPERSFVQDSVEIEAITGVCLRFIHAHTKEAVPGSSNRGGNLRCVKFVSWRGVTCCVEIDGKAVLAMNMPKDEAALEAEGAAEVILQLSCDCDQKVVAFDLCRRKVEALREICEGGIVVDTTARRHLRLSEQETEGNVLAQPPLGVGVATIRRRRVQER
jgi:hypothetical protein